ncbi:ASCH domain-containing protein [Listeria sp. FSL L7-1582]|nr:ASCH domain-containing protein [Listeria portnoyi]MBC6310233.1 ASCH domain-containing protein [Listeria portnoyi]
MTMSEIITSYWEAFAKEQGLDLACPDAWAFGYGAEMADRLGALVVDGVKTASCAAHCVHEIEGERIPEVGEYNIVLDGKNEPLVIIRYTEVELVKMNEVSQDFARSEGEGDLSYEYWYEAHVRFFTSELEQFGLTFTPDLLLVCQRFEVVHAR